MVLKPEVENGLVEGFFVCGGRRLIMEFEVVVAEGRKDQGVGEVFRCQNAEITVNFQQGLI